MDPGVALNCSRCAQFLLTPGYNLQLREYEHDAQASVSRLVAARRLALPVFHSRAPRACINVHPNGERCPGWALKLVGPSYPKRRVRGPSSSDIHYPNVNAGSLTI